MAVWQNNYLQVDKQKTNKKQTQTIKIWRKSSEKIQGTGCEMYTETLSSSFNGMSFRQAAEYSFCFNKKKTKLFFRICFVKLKLLLVAIEVKDEEANDDTEISINPRQAKTPGNTIGYFWAQSAEEVKRWVNNDDR